MIARRTGEWAIGSRPARISVKIGSRLDQLSRVTENQASAKRDDYQRAMTACLEARGYSVK